MTLLAQHGWGKSDKITAALNDESISGLIVSPRDETPGNAKSLIESIASDHPSSTRLFDPLFHAGMITSANDGKLSEYDYYKANLTRRDFIGTAKYAGYAGDTLGFQYDLRVSSIVSPTIEVINFGDSSAQIALQLADASAEHHAGRADDRPLLISFLINENALGSRDDLDAFLDAVTLLDAGGFYIDEPRELDTQSPGRAGPLSRFDVHGLHHACDQSIRCLLRLLRPSRYPAARGGRDSNSVRMVRHVATLHFQPIPTTQGWPPSTTSLPVNSGAGIHIDIRAGPNLPGGRH